MDQLKLAALDTEDLDVLSAHVQDAVLAVADIRFMPKEKTAVFIMNRFVWDRDADKRSGHHERRRAALSVKQVQAMRAHKIDPARKDEILELLAITFDEEEAPNGVLTLTFAGGGQIALDVECIEAQLSDLGAAWATQHKPTHFTD